MDIAAQPPWSQTSADLNVSLLVLDGRSGVAEHRNEEGDVLLAGIAGAGKIIVEERCYRLAAGQALVVPKGVRGGVDAPEGRFAYLTCHRRRADLCAADVAGEEADKETASRRFVEPETPNINMEPE